MDSNETRTLFEKNKIFPETYERRSERLKKGRERQERQRIAEIPSAEINEQRLRIRRERNKKRRLLETDEQRAERLRKDRERQERRRVIERSCPEIYQQRLRIQRERKKKRRLLETDERRAERLRKGRESQARRRVAERSCPEIYQQRLKIHRERSILKRSQWSPREREQKLERNRHRMRIKRLERKTTTMNDIDVNRGFHMKEGKYICQICGFASNSQVSFEEHSLNHRHCNNFQCCYCGDKFYYKYDMIKHEFIHIIEINKVHPITCDFCLSDHSSWKVYLKCRRESTNKKSLTCRKCFVSFKNSQEKKIHLQTCSKVMLSSRTSFLCELCGKMVSSLQSFNNHYRTHTGEKPYACKVCGRTFTTNVGLHYHKRIHTGVKPYKCNECGKLFAQRSSYVMHMKTHTGEKPFKCTVCGKNYVSKTVLNVHKKIHTEI